MDPTRREFLATAATTVGAAAASGLAQAEHQHEHSQPAASSEGAAITTRLTRSFGIKHPIICAPMAFIGGGALAAAVSRAGGLGFVGGGYAGTVSGGFDLDTELAVAKGDKFGVGFITWALARAPKMLTKALQHSPSHVFLSFGDPRPFAAEIRDAGAKLTATSVG